MIINELMIKGKLTSDIEFTSRFKETEKYWHLDIKTDKDTIEKLKKEFKENKLDKNAMLPKWFKEDNVTTLHLKSKFDFDCYYKKEKIAMTRFEDIEDELKFTKKADVKLIAGLSDNGALYPIALCIENIDNSNPFDDFEE